MRSFLLVFIFSPLGSIYSSPAFAEVIRSFKTEIRANSDATLTVNESIDYDFEKARRHGISRTIPLKYVRHLQPYTIAVRIKSVSDENGRRLPIRTIYQGDDLILRIGSPNMTLTGRHKFLISYSVRRAINFFEGVPEIYWSLNGSQSPVAIEQATAKVYPPRGVPLTGIKTSCLLQRQDAEQESLSSKGSYQLPGTDQSVVRFESGPLSAGDEFIVVAGLPFNSITKPNLGGKFLFWLSRWWPAITFPAALGLMLALVVWYLGREPFERQGISARWKLPDNLSPAQVGTLIDEKCDIEDILAILIYLAVNGHLRIKQVASGDMFGLTTADFEFIKSEPPENAPELTVYQKYFLDGIFQNGASRVTNIELKYKFFNRISLIRDAIYKSMVDEQYFRTRPDATRDQFYFFALLLLTAGVSVYASCLPLPFVELTSVPGQLSAYALGICLCACVAFLFAPVMPIRTIKGCQALADVLAFTRSFSLVSDARADDSFARAAREDKDLFARLLPYAMVLGVADSLARSFARLQSQRPGWYESLDDSESFEPGQFVYDLGVCLRSLESSLTATRTSEGQINHGPWCAGSGFGGGGLTDGSSRSEDSASRESELSAPSSADAF